jgi:hypothetical protein
LNKLLAVATLLLASVSLLMCQENPSTSAREPVTAQDFIGAWKFNPDKSSHSGTERESINIELKGDDYKFTYDWLAENGTELKWWFVTDMKGTCVNHTQVNGQPMTSKSCITLLGRNKFVNDTSIVREEYELSSNGRNLKINRSYKIAPSGKTPPKNIKLVFDRVSQ